MNPREQSLIDNFYQGTIETMYNNLYAKIIDIDTKKYNKIYDIDDTYLSDDVEHYINVIVNEYPDNYDGYINKLYYNNITDDIIIDFLTIYECVKVK